MATLVLDLDLRRLPTSIGGAERYHRALVLIRLDGRPIGQGLVPIEGGRVGGPHLAGALVDAVDWNGCTDRIRAWLGYETPPPVSAPLPPATIAVCSRDRPDQLRRCLEAVLRLPDDGQEVLIVDNCPSTEATQQLVETFGSVRYVREERPGLDRARNRALREARHDVIALLDDDVVPDAGWLRGLLRGFDDPSVLAVSGLVMPLELETEAQEWFERYSRFGRGFVRTVFERANLHPLAAGRAGTGASMALRRRVLDLVGPFDEALDCGTATRSGGDAEMFSRIVRAGYRAVYEPAALSWHQHRRTREEVLHTLYGYGVGVYAFWTRCLFVERDLGVFPFALNWLLGTQLPALARSLLRRPGSTPADLLLAELRGGAAGPWMYLLSRRRLRQRAAERCCR
jgi:GT2 family glycosyltransferase